MSSGFSESDGSHQKSNLGSEGKPKIHLEEETCQCEDHDGADIEIQAIIEQTQKVLGIKDETTTAKDKSQINDINNDNNNNNSENNCHQHQKVDGEQSNISVVDAHTEVICKKCNLSKLIPLKIPMYNPYTVKGLKKDVEYEYCTCGLTKNQPFCDKSHVGTNHRPIKFTLDRDQTMWLLCGCRYSKRPPHCDGSHCSLQFNPKFAPCKCDDHNW